MNGTRMQMFLVFNSQEIFGFRKFLFPRVLIFLLVRQHRPTWGTTAMHWWAQATENQI